MHVFASRRRNLTGVTAFFLALTVFTLTAEAQSLTTLYSFAGGTAGANPAAGVIAYTGGALVGTTPYGGAGYGTVYELTPSGSSWNPNVIYTFGGGADGALPEASLTLAQHGVLYGTTFAGGTTGNGTVFKLTPPAISGGLWKETPLYSFKGGSDGSGPMGGVVIGTGGTLYGTTFSGGSGAAGTVFQLSPPSGGSSSWTESVIYNFQGGKDGMGPLSGLFQINGALIGTTCCGTDGTVFQLHKNTLGGWNKVIIYSFKGYSFGDNPVGVIAFNGAVFGATYQGGANGQGIVFQLTKPAISGRLWTLTTIHAFTGGTDGGSPYGTLAADSNGNLYGTVTTGGTHGAGAVVEFSPPATAGAQWTENVLYSFTGCNTSPGCLGDGSQPFAGVVIGANNALFGTTAFGGTSDYGTVFELVP